MFFSFHSHYSCSVNWESQTFNATTYIMFLFIFGLLVPVIVIVYSYIKIIRTMRENTLRSGRVNKVESRVTSMIFVMIIGKFWRRRRRRTFRSNVTSLITFPFHESFPDCMDALLNFCIKRTVWRSGTDNACSCRIACIDCQIKYLL
jgi:hypothetical protein